MQCSLPSAAPIAESYLAEENFLAEQLPVVWTPVPELLAEVSKKLGGVTPINSLYNLTPEYWYYKK